MTVLVVQSRLASTRLPGKALLELENKPVLEWVLNNIKKVPADRYFLATDYNSSEKLFPVAQKCGFECFEGPEADVLERFCMLIKQTGADVIIRATGDNPFLFADAAEESVKRYEQLLCDYFTFSGLPHGSGVEILNAKSLLKACELTDSPYDHEHVGPALYNHKDRFNCIFEPAPEKWNFPKLRTTIDTKSDFRRASYMASVLGEDYSSSQIVELAEKTANPVLFVPSVEKGHGTGHLRRCISLVQSVYGDIYIPKDADLEEAASLLKNVPSARIVNELPKEGEYSVIVSDSFSLTEKLASSLSSAAPLVSLDEGSIYSDYCDYLLDIIPSNQYDRNPNSQKINFIPLPENRKRARPEKIKKVIVAVGGEDPLGFTLPVSRILAELGYSVTAVVAEKQENEKNIQFVQRVENLKEKLYCYDLVITHYGFTAFEAVSAGCAVLLVGTTKLHVDLSAYFGFAVLEQTEIEKKCIEKKLADIESLFPKSDCMKKLYENPSSESLAAFVSNLAAGTKISCPICGNDEHDVNCTDKVIARSEFRTVKRCSKCGMLYLGFSAAEKKEYKESYFFDEYKNQYGKTYLEDFNSIKLQGVRRSVIIDEIFWKKKRVFSKKLFPSVLDIGCAYGPFLSAAKDVGWNVYGTDISESAVKYVKETLGFPAVQSVFPDFNSENLLEKKEFDAVTMWYVIEHFDHLAEVLKKVHDLLPTGGIFAFSTPSASGVSAKYNTEKFFAQSPTDHFTLWQPEKCAKILEKFGFRVVKIVSTGQHPERFPYYEKHELKKGSLVFKFLSLYSKVKNLGDTFEVYCVKER